MLQNYSSIYQIAVDLERLRDTAKVYRTSSREVDALDKGDSFHEQGRADGVPGRKTPASGLFSQPAVGIPSIAIYLAPVPVSAA
jgi:hypothetical protein